MAQTVKASAYNSGYPGSIPGFGKIPWRRKWQPTPVFFPGKSHGQRNLVGYSPRGSQRVRHDWGTSLSFFLYTHIHTRTHVCIFLGSQVVLLLKNPPLNTGNIRGTGLIPGEGNGNPFQCSYLENPMDRGAWWATVHGVLNSQTRLMRLSMHACIFQVHHFPWGCYNDIWQIAHNSTVLKISHLKSKCCPS